jgi:hypothetical protein
MKKVSILVMMFASFAISACAQKLDASKVPAAVKASFVKEYPGSIAKWEKENGNYEVNFKKDGTNMSLLIQPNGSIVETETDIKITDLPATVLAYVKEHYPGKNVKEAAKIVKADRSVNYEAEVNGKDVIFDINGKFIKEAKD